MQRLVKQYFVEWWENFDLPEDDAIKKSYKASWIDAKYIDELNVE